jgi:membrane-bound lytic murein transglycosylase D
MKAKVSWLLVFVMHIAVLAGFSLMQGCKTAKAGGISQDQPAVLPPGPDITALPAVSSGEKVHSVQKGDTLSSIASSCGVSWKKLAEYNNISNPNQLKVGQELRIPDSLGAAPAPSAKRAVPVSSRPVPSSIKPGTYVIQKGDMLSTIAKRSGLTVAEIKAANSLTSDSLVAGKKLTIPKKGSVVAPAAAKAASAKTTNAAPAKAAADATLPAAAPIVDAATPAAAASTGAVTKVAAPATVPAAAAPVAKPASAPVYEHVLYPGETLDDVARQYGSSQQEIMKLNNITDPSSIKPGTKLLVPIPE